MKGQHLFELRFDLNNQDVRDPVEEPPSIVLPHLLHLFRLFVTPVVISLPSNGQTVFVSDGQWLAEFDEHSSVCPAHSHVKK